MKMRVGKIK